MNGKLYLFVLKFFLFYFSNSFCRKWGTLQPNNTFQLSKHLLLSHLKRHIHKMIAVIL